MKKIGCGKDLVGSKMLFFNSEQVGKTLDERKQERKQLFQRQNFILLIGLLHELLVLKASYHGDKQK
jgi:hypothetical protein